jgi:putative hydrolase of the HAD superfamily
MTRRPVTAILFDAGFTLVDLVRPVSEVYLEAACELGVVIDSAAFGVALKRRWRSLETDYRKKNPELTSSEEFERQAWRSFTAGLASDFPMLYERHREWHRLLVNHFDDPNAWRPAPSAIETLQALNANGVRTAVVSNWHSALPPILEAHGMARILSFILTSADAGRKKPHREIFEQALARIGAAADETAHVGDSWSDDVMGALDSGLTPIYLHRGDDPPTADSRVQVIRSLCEITSLSTTP